MIYQLMLRLVKSAALLAQEAHKELHQTRVRDESANKRESQQLILTTLLRTSIAAGP